MDNFSENSTIISYLSSVSGFIPSLFTFTLIFWYVKFQWDRRRLMELASKIQGPTSYPIVGNLGDFLLKAIQHGDRNIATFEMIKTKLEHYPDIVRLWLGPELIVGIAKPEYLEKILNNPNCLEKGYPDKFMKPYTGVGLLSAPVHIWRKNRKRINPSFNQRNLDSFVEIFNDNSRNLVKELEKKISVGIIDIFPIVATHNLDNVFGSLIQFKGEASERIEYGTMLDRAMAIATKRLFTLWFHNDFIFKMSSYHTELVQLIGKIKDFTNQVIQSRRSECELILEKVRSGEIIGEGDNRKQFLDILLQSNLDGEITDEQLRDEVNSFIAAGSDTTAASVCFCMLTLGMHPEFQQKVHEELIDVLGNDNREITASDLPKLQYLERVIKETLRLFPIAPFMFRKPAIEIDLGDVVIPVGCSFLMSVFNLHRNPALWKDPLIFNPDNFLPQEISKRHPYAYLPFSGGPRSCIGSKFAMMVMKAFLGNTIRKFHIKCEYKSIEDVALKINILMRPVNGFKVSFQLRQ